MSYSSFAILYVNDVAESVAFYSKLIKSEPIENAPTFALFALEGGMMLGLWRKADIEPAASHPTGASEISISFEDKVRVDAMHQAWSAFGVKITLPPKQAEFGYSFVAEDPDGHRIRVMTM